MTLTLLNRWQIDKWGNHFASSTQVCVTFNYQKNLNMYLAVFIPSMSKTYLIGCWCRAILIIILLWDSAENWAESPSSIQDGVCRGEKTNFIVMNGKFCKAVWSDPPSITRHFSWAGRKSWITPLPGHISEWIMRYHQKHSRVS